MEAPTSAVTHLYNPLCPFWGVSPPYVSADALESAVPRLSWAPLMSADALESAVPRLSWAPIVSADALEPAVPRLSWALLVSADALVPAVPRLSWAQLVSADALEPAVLRLSHIMSPAIMCQAFSSPLTLWSSCLDKKSIFRHTTKLVQNACQYLHKN